MRRRNRIENPLPGDWLCTPDGRLQVRIDMVKNGIVYFARFVAGDDEARALIRLPLTDFVESARAEGARPMRGPR